MTNENLIIALRKAAEILKDEGWPDHADWVELGASVIEKQQPRLMTLQETMDSDECWLEARNNACGYGEALLSDDAERVEFFRPHCISTLDFYEYGLVWRCWTHKPTDEQRAAAKWEGEK